MWRFLILISLILLMLFVLWRGSYGASLPSPMEEVKTTIDRLRKIVSDPLLKKNKQKQETAIKKELLRVMDFDEMAKRSLGRHWKNYPNRQSEFIAVFASFMEAFYKERVLAALDNITLVAIDYKKERIDGEFAEVEVVVRAHNDKIGIVYKLRWIDGRWKAYDVVVENISIVNNFRSQFDRVITQESFDELIKRLRDKIRELNK